MGHSYTEQKYLRIAKNDVLAIRLFWCGFILYTLAYTLTKTTQVNYLVSQFIQGVSIFIFSAGAILLFKFKFENNYLKWLFILYYSWLFFVVPRGILLDYASIKLLLFDAWFGLFIYFAPLILLFKKKLGFYKIAFDVVFVLSAFYILFNLVFLKDLLQDDLKNLTSQAIVEYFTRALSVPCGFLWLTYIYHSKKRRSALIFVTLVTLLLVIIRARRALILITIFPVAIAYIMYVFNHEKRLKIALLSILAAIVLSLAGYGIYSTSLFDSLRQRGLEDTRSGVEICFSKDMQARDWIFGKGINGEYFCPNIDPGPSPYRSTIETDYLQIILKGGLINLVLLLLIMIPAAIKGIFYSKNMLSKAAGYWILLWLLSLYPINVSNFSMSYLLVWISVGICYSRTLRDMPEDVVKLYFTGSK